MGGGVEHRDPPAAGAEPTAAVAAPSPPAPTPPAAGREGRIEFLDALRGVAALLVAVQHAAEGLWPSYTRWSIEVFRPGEFGVVLFFICSGFIIPVSLERYRSVGRFWLGRVFRLYPLYLAMLAAALVLHYWVLQRYHLTPEFKLHWLRNIPANATMAQELTGHPLVLGQSWTLAYELVFYLLVSLLFVARGAGRPAWVAVTGFAAAVMVGTAVPARLLTQATPLRVAGVVAATVAVAAVAIWFSDRSARSVALCVVLAGLAVPLVANRAHHFWVDCLFLSIMFTGTVLHRVTTGRAMWRHGAAVVAVAVTAIVVAHLRWFQVDVVPGNGARTSWRAETLTFTAAFVVFGLGLALRRRRFPRPLRLLGEISYSVYLSHAIVMAVVPWWGDSAWLTLLRWVVVTLVASWVTWRVIERPFHALGRRLAAPRPGRCRVVDLASGHVPQHHHAAGAGAAGHH